MNWNKAMRAQLDHTDIVLTNLLQLCGERSLGDVPRSKLLVERDRIRILLARIDKGEQ